MTRMCGKVTFGHIGWIFVRYADLILGIGEIIE